MITRIQQLSADIANQIAAGEVVERPASVIKELLENAGDANATDIRIDIGYGGLNLIRVADNGDGIWAEDLPLAICAHATSKISVLEDLYRIGSMGFRGEALASIASVSKLRIQSKPAKQTDAMQLHRVSAEWLLEPCARSQGTTVEVLDIFYNAPVRKKFLKSERNEFQAIEQVVKRFALAQPQIAIVLSHNGSVVFELPVALKAQSLKQRIVKMMGKPFLQSALEISSERAGLRLHGWISGRDYQRSQQDKQYLYVNQRMVRDKLLMHALKQAYEGALHPGRHPACVLHFEIASEDVDVNVHPTKHELRFVQPRLVHDFILHELRSALNRHTQSEDRQYPDKPEKAAALPIYERAAAFKQDTCAVEQAFDPLHIQGLDSDYALLTLARRSYLTRIRSLYQHAWRWKLQNMQQPLATRPMLVPFSLPLDKQQSGCLQRYQTQLQQWGIILTQSQNHGHWIVSAVPIGIPQLDIKSFLWSVCRNALSQPQQGCRLQGAVTVPQPIDAMLSLLAEHIPASPALSDINDRQLIQQYLLAHETIILNQQHPDLRWLDASRCEQLLNE